MASRSLLIALSATVCLIDSTLAQNGPSSDSVSVPVENGSGSASISIDVNANYSRDEPADAVAKAKEEEKKADFAVEILESKEEKVELVLEKFLQTCEIAEKWWKPRARGLGAGKVMQKRENLKQALSALTVLDTDSTCPDEECLICYEGSLTRNGAGVVGCKNGHFVHLDCQIKSGQKKTKKEQKCPKCRQRFDTAIVDFYRENVPRSGFTNLFKKQPRVDAALSEPAHVGTGPDNLKWKAISLEYQSFFDVFGAALCESGLRFPWAVELEEAKKVNEALATLFGFYKKHAGRSKAWKEAADPEAEQATRPATQAEEAEQATRPATQAVDAAEASARATAEQLAALAQLNGWLERNRPASDIALGVSHW